MNNIGEYLEYDDDSEVYYIKKWNKTIIKNYLSLGCQIIGYFKLLEDKTDRVCKILLVENSKSSYKITEYGISERNHIYNLICVQKQFTNISYGLAINVEY